MDTFLTPEEIRYLTGRQVKAKQVDALRRMGIPFFVNARGMAIVARVAIEGRATALPVFKGWKPKVLGG
ncbi:DUF4224 domain-containing protein [Pandoraea cepalis]|uniref:DUF4224 domain-containing protein n=1 Tax=Pandoraea cepalis TaxID=2508294 RepID=A0A5E4W923_9BURK|nr:DUF4224 domain-containing protein [Pandoraea cepalis]VVE20369.1 hypothetical protein PCE31107_03112 [Pandoraea cepalis]